MYVTEALCAAEMAIGLSHSQPAYQPASQRIQSDIYGNTRSKRRGLRPLFFMYLVVVPLDGPVNLGLDMT